MERLIEEELPKLLKDRNAHQREYMYKDEVCNMEICQSDDLTVE
jgi:hypothetical protein